jgi:hypothetical protein
MFSTPPPSEDSKSLSLIDKINGSCLGDHYNNNPNDATLAYILRNDLKYGDHRDEALYLCYEHIITNDRIDIINSVVSKNTMNVREREIVYV